MLGPRNTRIWVATLGLAAVTAWWHWRGPVSSAGAPESASVALRRPPGDARSVEVLASIQKHRPDELVASYARWSGNEQALAARRLALAGLFSERQLAIKLKNVLDAVESDQTPIEQDPLWSFVVDSLAEVWNGATIDRGRDLLLMEHRARARRAVLSSIVKFAGSESVRQLSAQQRGALSSDFIDLYAQLGASERGEITQGLAGLGQRDVASILSGSGLEGGQVLAAQRDRDRMLAEGKKALLGAEPASDAPRPLPENLEELP